MFSVLKDLICLNEIFRFVCCVVSFGVIRSTSIFTAIVPLRYINQQPQQQQQQNSSLGWSSTFAPWHLRCLAGELASFIACNKPHCWLYNYDSPIHRPVWAQEERPRRNSAARACVCVFWNLQHIERLIFVNWLHFYRLFHVSRIYRPAPL